MEPGWGKVPSQSRKLPDGQQEENSSRQRRRAMQRFWGLTNLEWVEPEGLVIPHFPFLTQVGGGPRSGGQNFF